MVQAAAGRELERRHGQVLLLFPLPALLQRLMLKAPTSSGVSLAASGGRDGTK